MMLSILILTFMISAVLTESNISIHFDCSKLQFWERKKVVCNASTPVFQCAWDIFGNQYEMKCVRKPILIRIGNRPTIQGGLHYGPCSKDRYQPFHIVSNRTVDCWYLKNNCTEEGHVLCDNKTGDLDRTCRCDYTNGYAFVQSPKNNVSCKPSEEDCSCYIKVCKNETHQLNPEYKCVESYNSFDFNDTCLITEKSHDKKPETDSFSPFTFTKLASVSDPIESGLVASVRVICLIVSAILFVVIVFTFGPFYVRRTKSCSGEVQEGDHVVIEFGIYGFAVINNIQIRHREKFLDFEDLKYTVTEKSEYFCHTFTIRMNDVVLDDIGTYECIVSTLATRLGCKYKFTGKYYLSCKQSCQTFFSDGSLLHLDTPPSDVIREINTLRNKKEAFDKLKYAVLVYIMMNERTSVKDMQQDDKLLTTVCQNIELSPCKPFKIKDAIEQLEGTFLKRSRNIFEFSHDILSKAVWISYTDIDAELCVSTCKWSYIEDYIRPLTWPVHEYDVCVRVDNTLIITRLVKELSGGNSWSVGQYLLKCYPSCFEFINDFCQHYMEKENVKIDVLLTLCSAFSKVGTSFEVFKTCLVAKNKLFSSNIDQFGNCLWHYCVLKDYEGMISDIPDNDLDKIFNILNTIGYSACHLEFYLGRHGMIEKHISHIPRTFEYYSQLKKLYHTGENNFGRIIKTKHLTVIGKMDLLSNVLKETKFGSKQDFLSIKKKLIKIKNEIMIMVRIKQLPSEVEDKEIEKVLETSYGCKIIKQYRERHRQKQRITNVETGDRIVLCKPLKFPLPRQIDIAQFKVNIYHYDQDRKE